MNAASGDAGTTCVKTPLWPRYVSTVDSGNLAGALLALAAGLTELQHTPQSATQLAGIPWEEVRHPRGPMRWRLARRP